MNYLLRLLSQLSQGNLIVFSLILITSILVVILRTLVPFTINFDQSAQLEAAYRLVKGLGLTSSVFALHIPDISQSPQPQLLIWWPPGLSLLVSALLALGLPLVPVLKILYGCITLIGWFGWSLVASPILSKPLILGSIALPLHYVLACLLPLFYTPNWLGTDAILWAGIPFLILWFFKSVSRENKLNKAADGTVENPSSAAINSHTNVRYFVNLHGIGYVVLAGLLFGLLYCFRYASLFLAGSMFFMSCLLHWGSPRKVIAKYSVFCISSLLFIVPIITYTKIAGIIKTTTARSYGILSDTLLTSGLPLNSQEEALNGGQYFTQLLGILSGISSIFGMTNLNLIFNKPYTRLGVLPVFNGLLGVLCLCLVICIPFLLISYRKKLLSLSVTTSGSPSFGMSFMDSLNSKSGYITELSLSLSFFPITLIVFLALAMGLYYYPYLRDTRHYIPVMLAAILTNYELAAIERFSWREFKPLRSVFVFIMVAFFLYNLVYRPVGSIVFHKSASLIRETVFATSESTLFSNKLITGLGKTKQALADLHRIYPQAVIYAPQAQLVYDAPEWLRVSMADGDFWQTAYTSQPMRLIMATFDICSWRCVPPNVLEQLEQQPGFQTVQAFPDEFTRIIMVELPAGYRFSSQSSP